MHTRFTKTRYFEDWHSSHVVRALRGTARVIAIATVVAAAIVSTASAGVFPEAEPTLLISDNVDDGVAAWGTSYPFCTDCPYALWKDADNYWGSFYDAPCGTTIDPDVRGGSWGTDFYKSSVSRTQWAYLVPKVSRPYDDYFDPDKWKNIQIEFDFEVRQLTQSGFLWAAQDPNEDGYPDEGYLFRIRGLTPASTTQDNAPRYESDVTSGSDCSYWDLYQITAEDTYQRIGGGYINSNCGNPSNPVVTYTVADPNDDATKYLLQYNPFRMRLSWYCGNLRVEIARIVHPTGATEATYKGCGASCGSSGSTNIDDCWCTVVEWTPLPLEQPLGPGAAGPWASWGYTSSTGYGLYDNVKFSYWDANCDLVCGDWQGWNKVREEVIPFKFLYEGSLFDLSAGRNILGDDGAKRGKIDIATEAPASTSTYNHSLDSNPYCNGWNLLQDLPPPTATGGNIGDATSFLQPMHTAVDYESNGASPPGFSWVDDFDNDPASAGYNPVPMVADGSTPINSSLLQAFDWYVEQKTVGAWAADPFEGCRKWYVILITDGDEACEFDGGVPNPDAVCEPDGAATKFANAQSLAGVDPLEVYTIGFSQSVADDSPLKCIADITGGQFLTAENAGELSQALYDVYYNLETEVRSFSPFKVSPPPSQQGGTSKTRDYLAIYPLFQPQDKQTLWPGNLLAFKLNANQTTLPDTESCALDTAQAIWDAASALRVQLDAHTEANPQRFVYMGSDLSGAWERYDLATMPDDSALQAEFGSLLDVEGGVNDVELQQVVNFLRNVYMDSDYDPATDGPPLDPRPEGYPMFGEFYHSQPVVVNPPNSPVFFYDFGYGVSGERGAHNYQDFIAKHAKRRRLVLAGSNDGMLHAFDGGVWDRKRNDTDPTTDPYDQIHDLGNGTELFAWVPQAVMNRLYKITAGGDLPHNAPMDTVDGPISVSDAFIDYDGDGDREWRTVALTSMRRGGRGIVALDITQPDPVESGPDYVTGGDKFPGCRVGSNPNCDGEFPKVLWEFSDTSDEDSNCPEGTEGDDCAPYWDLGWTWSKPAIARIAVYNSSVEQEPDDVFVAFFGGGWDQNDPGILDDNDTPLDPSDDIKWKSKTGNFFYGVNLEDGSIVFKDAIVGDVPAGVTALDSNNDGFHDRIYFADTNGGVWRLQYPDPTDEDATGADAGVMTQIFDFSADFPDRQEFFTRPVAVAAKFDGSGYTWALALGSGDRSDLAREDTGIDHFYFLIDAGDEPVPARGANDLVAVDYTQLTGSFDCNADTAFTPPKYGWYLSLRPTEKVVFDASVINGWVQFPTFDPTATEAVHNVPDQCGAVDNPLDGVDLTNACYATGLGRTYKLWYQCGLGDYTDHTDIITGSEDYTIGDNVYTSFTASDPGEGGEGTTFTETTPVQRTHTTTNWRQE